MKAAYFILVLSLILNVSCSRKSKPDSEANIPQVATQTDTDLIVEADEQKSLVSEEKIESPQSEIKKEEKSEIVAVEAKNMESEGVVEKLDLKADNSYEKASIAGELGEYTLARGETLMMAAFKIYGDYGMWKELAKLNPQIKNGLKKGLVLKFKAPAEKFVWNPSGEPYLIKKGDTLGTISNDKYGTPKKWKKIWNNNKPLIKNPNLIFAGFTLYCLPETNIANL